jgi:hypothetical protein
LKGPPQHSDGGASRLAYISPNVNRLVNLRLLDVSFNRLCSVSAETRPAAHPRRRSACRQCPLCSASALAGGLELVAAGFAERVAMAHVGTLRARCALYGVAAHGLRAPAVAGNGSVARRGTAVAGLHGRMLQVTPELMTLTKMVELRFGSMRTRARTHARTHTRTHAHTHPRYAR